jgi:glycosyltransferase involved in cell wall biosynthesis
MLDILLGTYNGARFLKQQLDSIAAQTNADWRLITRDDGSEDSTKDIIKAFAALHADRVRVLDSSQGRLGVVKNYATLLAASDAPYTMFCDQDDVWNKDKIQTTMSAMLTLENTHGKHVPALVHTDSSVIDDAGNTCSSSFSKAFKLYPDDSSMQRLLVQNCVHGSTVLMNRSLVQIANPIPKEALMHDHWVACIARATGHIFYVDQPTMQYRKHAKNVIGAVSVRQTIVDRLSGKRTPSPYPQAEALYQRIKDFPAAQQFSSLFRDFISTQKLPAVIRSCSHVRMGTLKEPWYKAVGQVLWL